MKNTYGYLLLIIIIVLLLFKINNTTSTNVKESFDSQNLLLSTYTNTNPISNSVDTRYLGQKASELNDLYQKLNKLREFLYNQPLDKMIQLKGVYKNEKNIT